MEYMVVILHIIIRSNNMVLVPSTSLYVASAHRIQFHWATCWDSEYTLAIHAVLHLIDKEFRYIITL